jgi:hypothetical protein
MQVPSINLIGGALAVAALGAVIFFGVQASPCAGVPPTVSTVAPVLDAPVLKPPVTKKSVVYRKVLKGGKLGDAMACKQVRSAAAEYTKAQVLAAAKQYGLSPAQVSALRVCLN